MPTSTQAVQNFLKQKNLDYFLIQDPVNIFWFSGFQSSHALLLIDQDGDTTLATDSRYALAAQVICAEQNFSFILLDNDFKSKFASTINGRIAVEKSLTLDEFTWLKKIFSVASFRSFNAVIKTIRSQKTITEINHTKKAARHTSAVLETFFYWLTNQKNITERQAAFELEHRLRGNGQYGIAFDSIVAFGKNSAIPHHHPSDQVLQHNQNILIDCGATYQGYHADITRNIWYGDIINTEYQNAYNQLLTVQTAANKKLKNGVNIQQLCESVRNDLGTEAKNFTHSLGHGTGLEIHEFPNLSIKTKKNAYLQTNQIVTCEPGLYYNGKFGIRIEDQLIIGEQSSEIISLCPKFLMQRNAG